MYLAIDTDTPDLEYDEIVTLEGVEYLFSFYWSARESRWYLSLYDQDENPLALWIAIVISTTAPGGLRNLLRRFVDPRLPAGLLYCYDASGQDTDIVLSSDLGERVPLIYITSDDPDLVGINIRAA